jgi:hypothetical protein
MKSENGGGGGDQLATLNTNNIVWGIERDPIGGNQWIKSFAFTGLVNEVATVPFLLPTIRTHVHPRGLLLMRSKTVGCTFGTKSRLLFNKK